MRLKFLVGLLIACSMMSSCTKDSTTRNDNSIVGNWELRISNNGWGGTTVYPAGNGYISKFTSDTYEVDSVGKVISTGTYKIITDKPYLTDKTTDRIIYNGITDDTKTFVYLSNDSLSFIIDAYDAGSTTYVRQP